MVVTVPTLAIAAHGVASGAVPGLGGIALCLMIGVLAGVCTGGRCGAVVLLAVLSAAQFLSHLALAVSVPASAAMDHTGMNHAGMDHAGMSMPADVHGGPLGLVSDHLAEMSHLGGADGTTMLLTHLIAIPLCALLIAAAVAVFTVITSVLAVLRGSPAPVLGHVASVVARADIVRWHRIDRGAGAGERGPPVLIA
ncbi:hypothetical protein GCM10007298_09460 [Williamsia phyllosphaerae]|uniref:Uncharacterized protein n=1 Tax=Williamsia phyllosphaerae TaxID=885042 RepID=A0ABQ1UCM3_9NOCA|nr:hypothetical protein GCM10007298_09460 [Williamsia phyllosphaerae]